MFPSLCCSLSFYLSDCTDTSLRWSFLRQNKLQGFSWIGSPARKGFLNAAQQHNFSTALQDTDAEKKSVVLCYQTGNISVW